MQHERAAMLADLRRNSIEPLLARFEAMQAESGDLAERLPGQMTKETERTKAAVIQAYIHTCVFVIFVFPLTYDPR